MQSLAVLRKDLRCELRNRSALNAILLFAITSLGVVGFASGQRGLPLDARAALLWIVLFFAAFAGLSHVFVHEEDSGTAVTLALHADPLAIFFGKLMFNMALMAAKAAIVVPLYVVMLGIEPFAPWAFWVGAALGCMALCSSATIVAAIIARAQGRGALYGALGFPVLLPLLLLAVSSTRHALLTNAAGVVLIRDIIGLASYTVMVLASSVLLFPVLWED